MLRRVLLAVLLCLSAWALLDRAAAPSVEGGTLAARDAASEPSSDAGSPDGRWSAPQPLKASAEGVSSTRDLQGHAIELPRVSRREQGRLTRFRHTSHRLPPSTPPHLHDIPLLI